MKIVLVHGFLGSSLNWGPLKHRLYKDFGFKEEEIICPNLLWHSKRPGPMKPELWTENTLFNDLKTQIPQNEKLIVLGHSYGLRPLLYLSLQGSFHFEKLIALDASPELSESGQFLLAKILEQSPTQFSNREEVRKYFDGAYGAQSAVSRFLQSNIGPLAPSSDMFGWRFQKEPLLKILKEAPQNPLWEAWSSFINPIIWILGAEASYVRPEILDKGTKLRNAKSLFIERVPNAGHWVHSDNLNGLLEVLKRYISVA